MVTGLTKYQSVTSSGGAVRRYHVEVYRQPALRALVASACHLLDRATWRLTARIAPRITAYTHRHGCPNPQPMTRPDGSETPPMCVCMPLCARIDMLCYSLAHSHRETLTTVEVNAGTYDAITGADW